MSNKKKDIEKWLTLPQQETLDILKSSSKKGVLITSGDITEVHSVVLMNKDTPFQQFNKPYADKYKGKVLLEGY